MNKIAFLFPGQGQGSISVGMGLNIQKDPRAQIIFSQADELLNWSISKLCFEGPEEELLENAQLASLVVSLAYASTIDDKPDYLAGHSVGFVTALAFSGVIKSLSETLMIIQKRMEFMKKACQKIPGRMVVLTNPKIGKIKELCDEYGYGVEISLFNSSKQIVLSGLSEKIDKIVKNIEEQELTRKVIPLQTAGAFHSKCMGSASDDFAEFLKGVTLLSPSDPQTRQIPIISNSKAQIINTAGAKKELAVQLCSPVLWLQSMKMLQRNGITTFIEVGHGTVLSKNLLVDFKEATIIPISK